MLGTRPGPEEAAPELPITLSLAGCCHHALPAAHPPPPAGVPFRETHHISGAAVKLAEDRGCELSALSVADLQGIHPLFADDVVEVRTDGLQSGAGFATAGVLRGREDGEPALLLLLCRSAPERLIAQPGCLCLGLPRRHPPTPPARPTRRRCGTSSAALRCGTPRAAPRGAACWSRWPSCAPTWRSRRSVHVTLRSAACPRRSCCRVADVQTAACLASGNPRALSFALLIPVPHS